MKHFYVTVFLVSLLGGLSICPPSSAQTATNSAASYDRFGGLAERWTRAYKMPIQVNNRSKVSGVPLYTSLQGRSREAVLAATASFFSHKGAISYWKEGTEGHFFVLSTNYEQKLNHEHWSQKMINLFKTVQKHHDHPESIGESSQDDLMTHAALTRESALDCVQLMTKVFSEDDIAAIFRGEKAPTIRISTLTGESKLLAEKIYAKNTLVVSDKSTLAPDPELRFEMDTSNKDDVTRRLFLYTPLKKGSVNREVGGSYFGTYSEESAQSDLKNFWMVSGDKDVLTKPSEVKKAITDGRIVKVETASYYTKLEYISRTFDVPVIAVLPNVPTTNEVYISSSLSDTLQHLSTEGEPLFFKMRSGILLVCTGSFLGDKGVTTALPLATLRDLKNAPKRKNEGYVSLLHYARIAAPLSNEQLADNVGEFGNFALIQKWRLLLRSVLREDAFATQLEAGDLARMSKSVAVSFNQIVTAERPNAKPVAAGDLLQLTERSDPIPAGNFLPKGYPEDYLVTRTVTFTTTTASGKPLSSLIDRYIMTNSKYVNGIPGSATSASP